MSMMRVNRVLCAGFVLLIPFGIFHPVAAQQGKPDVKQVASAQKQAKCSGKNMSCCKGTLSRSVVLASIAAKAKPVKSR